jgi:hypothetical protein
MNNAGTERDQTLETALYSALKHRVQREREKE